MKHKVPFQSPSFFLSHDDVALILRRTGKAVRDYHEKGLAPADLGDRIADFGRLFHFPIDQPHSPTQIGAPAHRALNLLRAGDPQLAAEVAFNALNGGEDWENGKPYKLAPCHRAWCELAHGVALGRGKHEDSHARGFTMLSKLHRKIRRLPLQSRNYLWDHLLVLSKNYTLVNIGLHYEERVESSPRLRRWLAEEWTSTLKLTNDRQFAHPYTKAHVAWNAAQVAAIDGSQGLFIDALGVLLLIYSKPSKRLEILDLLRRDDIAGAMMKDDRVKNFVDRASVGSRR